LTAVVFELMLLLRRHKNHITSLEEGCVVPVEQLTFTLQNEYFVLPRMGMKGAATFWFYFENPHGKVGSA
jgi:hypothetical protein